MKLNYDDVIKEPNKILRTKSEAVELPLQKEDRELLNAMVTYVRNSQDEELAKTDNLRPAVGIAAIQLGIQKQMLAVVTGDEREDGTPEEYALVNPKILSYSVQQAYLKGGEGCLSVEDVIEGYVPRSARIKVRAYDMLQDKEIVLQASGFLAIVLQHEIDHLHGVMFEDHINKTDPWMEIEGAIVIG